MEEEPDQADDVYEDTASQTTYLYSESNDVSDMETLMQESSEEEEINDLNGQQITESRRLIYNDSDSDQDGTAVKTFKPIVAENATDKPKKKFNIFDMIRDSDATNDERDKENSSNDLSSQVIRDRLALLEDSEDEADTEEQLTIRPHKKRRAIIDSDSENEQEETVETFPTERVAESLSTAAKKRNNRAIIDSDSEEDTNPTRGSVETFPTAFIDASTQNGAKKMPTNRIVDSDDEQTNGIETFPTAVLDTVAQNGAKKRVRSEDSDEEGSITATKKQLRKANIIDDDEDDVARSTEN